jgi:hypothetical protein
LADVSDLGSDAVRHVGSSPITRTKKPFRKKGFSLRTIICLLYIRSLSAF